MKFEVTTDLIVHCKVKVVVEAESAEAAIDTAADLLPNNFAPDRAAGWRAKVDLRPPKGIDVKFIKATHFEQASGADRARKMAQ